jgi:hypothetical protein
MRLSSKALNAVLNLLIALFFLLLAGFAFVLPWAPYFRRLTVEPLLANPLLMTLSGIIFLFMGGIILMSILSQRSQYYLIKRGKHSVTVDETVIKRYVKEYLGMHFPEHEVFLVVMLKDNKIHITADLPYVPYEKQRPILDEVQDDLAALLKKVLSYHEELFLSVSFRKKDKESLA